MVAATIARGNAHVGGERLALERLCDSPLFSWVSEVGCVLPHGASRTFREWFDWMREAGVSRLSLHVDMPQGHPMWSAQGEWCGHWQVVARARGEWVAFRTTYGLLAKPEPPHEWYVRFIAVPDAEEPTRPDLESARTDLRRAILGAMDFSIVTNQDRWLEHFDLALSALDGHGELTFPETLPEHAGEAERRLLAAVWAAEARGGMGGGWDDNLYGEGLEEMFHRVVLDLYTSRVRCLQAVLND
jgi:hypothetical protein